MFLFRHVTGFEHQMFHWLRSCLRSTHCPSNKNNSMRWRHFGPVLFSYSYLYSFQQVQHIRMQSTLLRFVIGNWLQIIYINTLTIIKFTTSSKQFSISKKDITDAITLICQYGGFVSIDWANYANTKLNYE